MGLLDAVVEAAMSASSSVPISAPASGRAAAGSDGAPSTSPELAFLLARLLSDDGAHGGLDGLVRQFQAAGLGPVIGSWIARGGNLPISAEQLQQVLGPALGDLGGPAWQLLQRVLPAVVDQLTPQGRAVGGLGSMQDILHALRR